MKNIAVIGTGNMGSAIVASLRGHNARIICTAASRNTLGKIKSEMPDVEVTTDNVAAVKDADMIVLAVKPYVAPGVIEEIKGHVRL